MGKLAAFRLLALALAATALAAPARARTAREIAGPWQLSQGGTGASCRVFLESARSDAGAFFLAIPPACRHAMPDIATAGRWAAPDDGHLMLVATGGAAVLTLAAAGDGFVGASPHGTFTLMPVSAAPRDSDAAASPDAAGASASASVMTARPDAASPAAMPRLETISMRRVSPPVADLAGRYAVMRGTHDTGCMLTLDRAHAKGGDRAQLAPGCRDQGIVIFDPTSWQVVRGGLVLTARAGHQTRLERGDGDSWEKDPKEGGKPLGLKKL